jgi:hypothetical protein
MRRNTLIRSIFFLALIVIVGACKAKKAVVTTAQPVTPAVVAPPPVQNTDNSKTDRLNAIKSKMAAFNTLSIKAKADLNIANKSNDVTMNIRIRNNEAIWVSVTAIAGLEVARALITPDSVKVLNRLDNVYIKKPFSYIYEFTNDQITFKTLQSVLVGNLITEFVTDQTDLSIDGPQVQLKNTLGSMIYNVNVNDQNKVVKSDLSDPAANQSLIVEYGEFLPASQQEIPQSVMMKSSVKNKNIGLNLKFSKVEIDVPVDLPFKVPERFLIKN